MNKRIYNEELERKFEKMNYEDMEKFIYNHKFERTRLGRLVEGTTFTELFNYDSRFDDEIYNDNTTYWWYEISVFVDRNGVVLIRKYHRYSGTCYDDTIEFSGILLSGGRKTMPPRRKATKHCGSMERS